MQLGSLMLKLFIPTLGWINKRGSEEEAMLPQRETRRRLTINVCATPSLQCCHGQHLEIWEQFWCYSGETCWDCECDGMDQENQTGCPVWVGFFLFWFFLFSFIMLLSELLKKCLFFYFFLVYFSLFEETALSVGWNRCYLWKKTKNSQVMLLLAGHNICTHGQSTMARYLSN